MPHERAIAEARRTVVVAALASALGPACAGDPGVARGSDPSVAVSAQAPVRLPADAQIRRDPGRGTITLLAAANLSEALEQDAAFAALQASGRFADVALAFLAAQRSIFKLSSPADELVLDSVRTDELGLTHVRLRQIIGPLPVWNAEVIVHLDRGRHVYRVQGSYVATPSGLPSAPRLRESDARRTVASLIPGLPAECDGCPTEVGVFVPRVGEPRLAYRVLAAVSPRESWAVVVDGDTGAVLDRAPTVISR
jgi:Zn-dependent metalloprotease